jgi:hypothetical protein
MSDINPGYAPHEQEIHMTTPEEAARRIMERDAPAFLVEGKLGSDAVTVARALLAAEARIWVLEEALTDVANGNVPKGFLNNIETESKASFQERLATWLQQRARRALAKPEEPTSP